MNNTKLEYIKSILTDNFQISDKDGNINHELTDNVVEIINKTIYLLYFYRNASIFFCEGENDYFEFLKEMEHEFYKILIEGNRYGEFICYAFQFNSRILKKIEYYVRNYIDKFDSIVESYNNQVH